MHAILGLIALGTSAFFIKWIGRLLLIGAGFQLMSMVGFEVFLVQIETFIQGQVGGLPATMTGILGILNLDLYLNWCFLGFSVKLSLIGLYRLIPAGNAA